MRILSAPEAYYALLAEHGVQGAQSEEETDSAEQAEAAPAAAPGVGDSTGSCFRVRVGQVQGMRTKMLRVACETEEEARQQALDELGDEWKILEVIPA